MKVVSLYWKVLNYGLDDKCRKPCSILSTRFDFPFTKGISKRETKLRIKFSSKIKVVSEYIPYTILRLVLLLNNCNCPLSSSTLFSNNFCPARSSNLTLKISNSQIFPISLQHGCRHWWACWNFDWVFNFRLYFLL